MSLWGLHWDHAKYHHIYCPCPLHDGSLRLQTWIIVKFCRSHACQTQTPRPLGNWLFGHYFACATIVHSNAPIQIHVVVLMEFLHVKLTLYDQHDTLRDALKKCAFFKDRKYLCAPMEIPTMLREEMSLLLTNWGLFTPPKQFLHIFHYECIHSPHNITGILHKNALGITFEKCNSPKQQTILVYSKPHKNNINAQYTNSKQN